MMRTSVLLTVWILSTGQRSSAVVKHCYKLTNSIMAGKKKDDDKKPAPVKKANAVKKTFVSSPGKFMPYTYYVLLLYLTTCFIFLDGGFTAEGLSSIGGINGFGDSAVGINGGGAMFAASSRPRAFTPRKSDPFASMAASFSPGSDSRSVSTSSGSPLKSLSDFGIKAAAEEDRSNKGLLQFALIPLPISCLLVKFAPNGFWAEKIMNDALRAKAPWLMPLMPIPITFNFFHKGSPVKNDRGYNIRMFGFNCGNEPEDDALLELGKHICNEINKTEGNNTVCEIQKDRLFFTATRLTTWNEVCGPTFALRHLQEQARESVHRLFYEQHKDLVHAHFAPGTFSPVFAQMTGAPREEIDPEMLELHEQRQLEAEIGRGITEEAGGEA